MNTKRFAALFCFLSLPSIAMADNVAISVWVNEALVAMNSYSHRDFLQRQKEIAHYFTADGWTKYSQAQLNAKLPETVAKHQYQVSAVAISPPIVSELSPGHFEAKMPLLVEYKNPAYQQSQYLQISLRFESSDAKQGVRGYAVTGLDSKPFKPNCQCQIDKKEAE